MRVVISPSLLQSMQWMHVWVLFFVDGEQQKLNTKHFAVVIQSE